jgi:hypothetical protein
MNIEILQAAMHMQDEKTRVGIVTFKYEAHAQSYELHLLKERGKDWGYSLVFAGESGSEDEILVVETRLENDDAFFDYLVDAAEDALETE